MKKIKFILAFHNHQPVGNFDFVLDEAFNLAYEPFLDVLEKFPEIKMTLHYSGILWEWLGVKQPQYIERLKKMHCSGQLELMGGGFYEPILPAIPSRDRLGQLRMTNQFLLDTFGAKPRGMWVAERVWEPSLPRSVSEADIEYVVLDDSHFRVIGYSEKELLGMFITEEEGYCLRVFPISERLRYLIPFGQPEETIEYLRSLASEKEDTLIVLADDGEKLGNWPGTHQWVYTEKWLERFLTCLEENSDWIETVTFSEYIDSFPPKGRVYLPTASYPEMMEWALPAEKTQDIEQLKCELKEADTWQRYGALLGGGFWRNFLVKYPESNDMHKKMYYLSHRIHACKKLNSEQRAAILKELWQGQCNCAYWHGAFGGLYLKHLRDAIYQHLIEAEVRLDEIEQGYGQWQSATSLDINQDGQTEVLLTNAVQNLYFAPAQGGMLYEWDIRPKRFNLGDSLTRRKEAYHQKLLEKSCDPSKEDCDVLSIHEMDNVKEDGLENMLHYDWYRRASLLDHFLGWGSDFESFRQCSHQEEGDFVDQPYQFDLEGKKDETRLTMTRRGNLWRQNDHFPLEVKKTISWGNDNTFGIQYQLTNLSAADLDIWWGPEFNFSYIGGAPEEKFIEAAAAKAAYSQISELDKVDSFTVTDLSEGWRLRFALNNPACLWVFPLHTVSNSEAGMEKNYQSTVVLPTFKVRLPAKKTWTLEFDVQLIL